MIGSLSGSVTAIATRSLVIDVNGVGYRVFVPVPLAQTMTIGQSLRLHTHLAVRENALDLYGFDALVDLELFELLTTVSGVGPKAALTLMDGTTSNTLRSAIAEKNVGLLQNIPGIGKKTAEKIVLELSDKVALLGERSETGSGSADAEIVTALEGLGFRPRDIHQAISDNPELRELDMNEKIKRLISLLGR